MSGGDWVGEESFPVGGNQIIDLTRRVDKDSLQQIGQVGLRVNRIAMAGGNQAVEDSGALSTGVTASKQESFPLMLSSA